MMTPHAHPCRRCGTNGFVKNGAWFCPHCDQACPTSRDCGLCKRADRGGS